MRWWGSGPWLLGILGVGSASQQGSNASGTGPESPLMRGWHILFGGADWLVGGEFNRSDAISNLRGGCVTGRAETGVCRVGQQTSGSCRCGILRTRGLRPVSNRVGNQGSGIRGDIRLRSSVHACRNQGHGYIIGGARVFGSADLSRLGFQSPMPEKKVGKLDDDFTAGSHGPRCLRGIGRRDDGDTRSCRAICTDRQSARRGCCPDSGGVTSPRRSTAGRFFSG